MGKEKPKKAPSAIARDVFKSSEEFLRLCHGVTSGQYLENRIVSAFLSGWEACEQSKRVKLRK